MKKTLTVFIALLILGLIAYFFWPKGGNTPEAGNYPQALPFGESGDTENTAIEVATIPEGEVAPVFEGTAPIEAPQKLFKISSEPVAGFVALERGTSTIIRFVERATGHVFDSTLPKVEKARVTNNTIPKIYEAVFREDGSVVVMRHLKNGGDKIEDLSVALSGTTTATILPINTGSLIAGAGDMLIYTNRNNGGIYSSTFAGSNLRELLSPPFKSWRISRFGKDLLISPRASFYADGYAYKLSGGALAKMLGPLKGLATIASPTGDYLLYSYFDNGMKLYAKELAKNISLEMKPNTLIEKCVWSKRVREVFFCGAPRDGIGLGEPDLWYQGKTHFSDYIWSFNLKGDTAYLILDQRSEYGVDIDIINPSLTQKEDYLVFMNKLDSTLWAISF